MKNLVIKDFIKNKLYIYFYLFFILMSTVIIGFNANSLLAGKDPMPIYLELIMQYSFYYFFIFEFIIRANNIELENEENLKFSRSLPVRLDEIVKAKYFTNILFLLLWTAVPIIGSIIIYLLSGQLFNFKIYIILLGIYLTTLSIDFYSIFTENILIKQFARTVMMVLFILIIMSYFSSMNTNTLLTLIDSSVFSFTIFAIGLLSIILSYLVLVRRFKKFLQ